VDWKGIQFDWNKARAFWVVANEGSFSAAARALGMSQPTLGRAINSLEADLKLTLFERVGKGLELTESGIKLFEHVRPMAEAASLFSLAAQGQHQEVSGDVCISLTEFDAFFRLPECIQTLQQQAPNIRLEVVVSNHISDLKRREADIAIRYQRPTQEDLIAKKIGQENVFLYGHKDYVATLDLTDIQHPKGLKLIGFDHSDQMKSYLKNLGWGIEDEHFTLLCKNQMVQWQFIQQGVGVGFLPDHVAARDTSLVPVFVDQYEPIVLDVWLVTHRELHTSRKVRMVFDFLAASFALGA